MACCFSWPLPHGCALQLNSMPTVCEGSVQLQCATVRQRPGKSTCRCTVVPQGVKATFNCRAQPCGNGQEKSPCQRTLLSQPASALGGDMLIFLAVAARLRIVAERCLHNVRAYCPTAVRNRAATARKIGMPSHVAFTTCGTTVQRHVDFPNRCRTVAHCS